MNNNHTFVGARTILPVLTVLLTLILSFSFAASPVYAVIYDPTVCADAAKGEPLTDECLEMIEAFPEPPNVIDIQEDRFTLGSYSFWRVGPHAVPTYDAPGGGTIGSIPQGFNFVTAVDLSVDGWLQIQGGEWINIIESGATYKEPSYFNGVQILDGLKYPFAWVLDLSRIYVSETPGGDASQATGRYLERYERVNIFATAEDSDGWLWYMIGVNQWVKQTFVAVVHKTERPEEVSGRWVAVDLYEQTLVAYEGDTPVFATLVATGIPPFDTNEGLFHVWERLDRDPMSGATGAPEAYALQTVPWVMYFDGGISLHGTYWHDLFGYRQSHGCVNLTVSDAKFIYNWFLEAEPNEDGDLMNYVYVHSTGEYGSGVLRQ